MGLFSSRVAREPVHHPIGPFHHLTLLTKVMVDEVLT